MSEGAFTGAYEYSAQIDGKFFYGNTSVGIGFFDISELVRRRRGLLEAEEGGEDGGAVEKRVTTELYVSFCCGLLCNCFPSEKSFIVLIVLRLISIVRHKLLVGGLPAIFGYGGGLVCCSLKVLVLQEQSVRCTFWQAQTVFVTSC